LAILEGSIGGRTGKGRKRILTLDEVVDDGSCEELKILAEDKKRTSKPCEQENTSVNEWREYIERFLECLNTRCCNM